MQNSSRRSFIAGGIAAALSPFYSAAQNGGTLRVRPVLQDLGPKRVTITWLSLDDQPARIELARRGQPGTRSVNARSTPLPPSATGLRFAMTKHRVEIGDLTPSTDYVYTVLANGRPVAGTENSSFRTPGRGAARLVVLGDSGTDSPEQRRLANMMIARRPELMLHTGDLVYPTGTVESYMERFFAPYAPLLSRIPVFPCPGNHDYYHEQAKFYIDLHSVPRAGVPAEGQGRYYSFDWDNAHVVVLDSNAPLEAAAHGRGAMLEWLEKDLAATKQFWRIAMFHHPPYAGGPNEDDPLSHLARRFIVPILERHGVQLVLNGHEHSYQRSWPVNGIVYLTTGGGGAELYPPRPRPEAAFQQDSYHFLEASLEAAVLEVQAVRIDGQVIDQVKLAPTPQPSAVGDAAGHSPAVAPGGLCVLRGRQFAPREGDVGAVQLRVNGEAALVVAAAADHVAFVMPPFVYGDATVTIANANGSAELGVTVQESAPAIFAIERDGQRLGALFHADGQPVHAGHPARVGEALTLYCTGTGRAGALTIETAAEPMETVPQPLPDQPGVEVLRFRMPVGAGSTLRLTAGNARSNTIPLW